MTTIASIVEGHGEVTAVPVLIRRIAQDMGVQNLNLPRPHRVPRGRMTDPREMGRALRPQADRVTDGGAVLVLVDGDDECAVDLARRIRQSAGSVQEDIRGAKEIIGRVIDAPCYQESTHQVKLSAAVSLVEARNCPWFTKLERDLAGVLDRSAGG